MVNRHFPSKLLLLGEYSLLQGSEALALPLPDFSGFWAQGAGPDLRPLATYLASHSDLRDLLDCPAFRSDIETKGLFFQSNIPQGYGLGSSGALSAAIYAAYAQEPTKDWAVLRQVLSQIECFFHGKSSGLDPLVAYVQAPVYWTSAGKLSPVSDLQLPPCFLLDAGFARPAQGGLVPWFLAQSQERAFQRQVLRPLTEAVGRAIAALQQLGGLAEFWPALREISALQFAHFQPMRVPAFEALWQEGLDTGRFYLKLCGAGGGGFTLGFSPELNTLLPELQDRGFKVFRPSWTLV